MQTLKLVLTRCRTFALAMFWLLFSGWQFAIGAATVCAVIGAFLLPWAWLPSAVLGTLIGVALYLCASSWIVSRSSAQ
jgi:hypothetical protein